MDRMELEILNYLNLKIYLELIVLAAQLLQIIFLMEKKIIHIQWS